MIDNFAIALTHGLLAIALWRLMARADLDYDPGDPAPPLVSRRGTRRPAHRSRDEAAGDG